MFDPAAFVIPERVAHVCAGGETPPLRAHAAAFVSYLTDKASGMAGRSAQEAVIERVRKKVGRMWNVPARSVGFVANVAEGVSMLLESIDWREGDNVCLDTKEFPSLVVPFTLAERTAPRVKLAQGTGADRVLDLVDESTRMIAVSYVSYLNGERFDLAKLRARADEVGALLVVDFTQAAGYLPIEAGLADFAFSACYKWLLGITGTAIAVWNETRQPGWRPATGGWHSLTTVARPDYAKGVVLRDDALRFTRGNPAHAALYVLDAALDFLGAYEAADVQAHVQALTTDLHARLTEIGVTPSTPADPARHGASICIDGDFGEGVVADLQHRGVYLWGGRGRLRISLHGYNSTGDLDRVMEELPPFLTR
jgi:selenocysteine lyase/cysteine desulfurase